MQNLEQKLKPIIAQHDEVSKLLSDPDVVKDMNRYRKLSQDFSRLEGVLQAHQAYQATILAIEKNREYIKSESDAELKALAQEELAESEASLIEQEKALKVMLIPADPLDGKNVIMEIRAGTGGDEAGLFAADLYRMYHRYAERQGWSFELLDANETTIGGFREVIVEISGSGVYGKLRYESGAHRVQRIPVTESSGRIQTSAATVAVLPEAEEADIVIRKEDLRIDTYRASGAGGQHINKTDSAVRITHLPTGVVVAMQDSRSQIKNREKAMNILRSRLLEAEEAKNASQRADARKNQVGSGDRSERIRTYNYPQGRVTDHRIGLTLYKLDKIMDGDLTDLIDPLILTASGEEILSNSED
ncbi:peptide chain release factor 1 [Entomospira culicis]|uniref:Peptide chain release factor 1 n=1 Tax=Entomospira culicis TaxID=2719989 RepID=A0A968GLH2_9SPIO|nr:peptide chain release factor 1 [Entomospira culicis]NIZ19771.1 peptide chain release factor 1 [Entomospira culicis]NIZ69985.1 peptide chain release factor 1 [Entomospira culicis]WDI37090.1 peptide chain release factor 1 [Entomospira culicis]WDI38719.1 peptide chain release factor 1 [Entomospira culicis]